MSYSHWQYFFMENRKQFEIENSFVRCSGRVAKDRTNKPARKESKTFLFFDDRPAPKKTENFFFLLDSSKDEEPAAPSGP